MAAPKIKTKPPHPRKPRWERITRFKRGSSEAHFRTILPKAANLEERSLYGRSEDKTQPPRPTKPRLGRVTRFERGS